MTLGLAIHAQSNYTTYQLAFRQGGVLTTSIDFSEVSAQTEAINGTGQVRQEWMLKREGAGKLLITLSAAPDQFLVREGNEVSLQPYDESQPSNYLWVLAGTVSASNTVQQTLEGDKLLALLANPSNRQSVLTKQNDGSLQMSTVNYGLSDDPYRLYVLQKTIPGSF